tara:strand:+ start:482 stop:814 length:333 start_codon:yes stop_codon:yes gene_type:complete
MPYLGTPPASELANLDINGQSLILDADADTHITADTDDQIDIHIAGADDFQFTANTFTALSGSAITLADGQLGTTQGTNSVPAIAWATDPNTGIFFGSNGSGQISFTGEG